MRVLVTALGFACFVYVALKLLCWRQPEWPDD